MWRKWHEIETSSERARGEEGWIQEDEDNESEGAKEREKMNRMER